MRYIFTLSRIIILKYIFVFTNDHVCLRIHTKGGVIIFAPFYTIKVKYIIMPDCDESFLAIIM